MLGVTLLITAFFGSYAAKASADVASDFQVSVMAPLNKITDWTAFKKQLATLKSNGVYALTTDIWWGDVEAAGDNQFDWSYYKTYANAVSESGLKWVPILSTHACGGNPGDDCNIPLPSWLWSKGSADEMKFKSETGYVNGEAISPFWSGISTQYNELYASFASNFASYKGLISKIYLSGGPSGELRYPSYYQSAGWSYPARGKFQVYTEAAKTAFRNAMISKYGSLNGVNQAWGLSLANVSQINPPSDGDSFYSTGGYNSAYGKDFLSWYQSVLENHLTTIAAAAHSKFDSVFGVRIGAKIAGIHWQMNNPSAPHSAEHAAGYYDYNRLIQKFKDNNLDLTFTALEMYDSGTSPNYSLPSTLVDTVSSIANAKGVRLNGENALATGNFQKIEEKITKWNYNGFTLLRLANLVNSDGSPTGDMNNFKTYVISHAAPVTNPNPGSNSVTIYYKKGFSTPYIHYSPVGGTWTTAPGVAMPAAEAAYPGYAKSTINIGSSTQLEAVFNNGSGTWDNNNSKNYFFGIGTWTFTPGANGAPGTVTQGAPQGASTGDTSAPSVPANLALAAKTSNSVSLSWSASTDNVGVTGYEIWRDGAKIATTASSSYTNSGLTAGTKYTYTVKAYDAAGNISAASAALSVTTDTASGNSVTIYYKKGFTTPYIHYRPAGGTWTTVPGTAMPAAEAAYPGYAKITINIGSSTQLEAVFNNGSGTWDNNNSKNYFFNTGISTFTPGVNGALGSITSGAPSSTPLTATDWGKQSIYLIMTDRFSNGDTTNDNYGGFNSNNSAPGPWHGGDFQGIINHLD
ncbi:family 14 glycosylhydrolase [Paenibacillus lacisoli]|uniref:family 14 glycosylhydrolase n=1 Tax=Paenibacillus lacisoli TaxID=3064525 RepID=UPI00387E7DE4